MKSFSGLIIFLFFLIACDPVQLVYVKNYTGNEINLDVKFEKQAPDFARYDMQIADTILENPKEYLKYHFINKLPVLLTSDTSYLVSIPPNKTGLLCPLTIGFPLKEFNIKGIQGSDSVKFHVSKAEMKTQLSKGRLQKVNWTFYIYNYHLINP
jgi:hypothetical protein